MAKKQTKKKQLCQKEPCFTEQRSLYVSDLSKLACISFRSTHTNHKHSEHLFLVCVWGLPPFPQNHRCGLLSRCFACISWKAIHPPGELQHWEPLVVWRAESECVIVTDTGLERDTVTCVQRKDKWVWRCSVAVEETESQVHHDPARPVDLP